MDRSCVCVELHTGGKNEAVSLCQMEYSSRGSKDTGRDKPRPCLLQENARQGKGEAKKIDTYQQGWCGETAGKDV